MSINLHQILSLVGKLDDAPGDDTARERVRCFLKEDFLFVRYETNISAIFESVTGGFIAVIRY